MPYLSSYVAKTAFSIDLLHNLSDFEQTCRTPLTDGQTYLVPYLFQANFPAHLVRLPPWHGRCYWTDISSLANRCQAMSNSNTNPSAGASRLSQANPRQYPVGPLARRNLRQALKSSGTDPATTITTYQREHSLHALLAKSFGTAPNYEVADNDGAENDNAKQAQVEPFDPTPALQFLHHLSPALTHAAIHQRLATTLLTTLESDIERTSLTNPHCVQILLGLLSSAWSFVAVPELRPVVSALVKKLGEGTPRELLVRLAEREVVEVEDDSGNDTANDGDNNKVGDEKTDEERKGASQKTTATRIKHSALLQQFAPKMKRLVYEADWESNHGPTAAAGPSNKNNVDPSGEGSLTSPNVLSDLIRPAVVEYCEDDKVRRGADLAFVQSVRERRVHTVARRVVSAASAAAAGGGSGGASASGVTKTTTTALASLTGVGGGSKSNSNGGAEDKSKVAAAGASESSTAMSSSAHAVATIRDIIGDRPKLMGAVMNMLIAEHGKHAPADASTSSSTSTSASSTANTNADTVLGGSSYLHCTLAADILLTYKQLPRQYEHVGILAKILDGCVRAGTITDDAVSQIQGCLRIIFQQRDVNEGDGAANSMEAAAARAKHEAEAAAAAMAKARSGGGSGTKAIDRDDSDYQHKLLRKIITAAVRAMREADPRGLFLNPVTDEIAPGYSKVIKEPMCIRTIEDKAEEMEYGHLSEYERDVRLMYSNCIKYNIGKDGTWFRGEARRQEKVWKDDILSQARELYKKETAKRRKQLERADQQDEAKKKKAVLDTAEERKRRADKISKALKDASGSTDDNAITKLKGTDVDPLPPSKAKRRKKDMDYPSMPCIATMLLSDPFVVRIILDRILRSLRADVLGGKSIPAAHSIVPSLLQLLCITQFATQLCAVRGKRFIVPDAGLTKIPVDTDNLDPAAAAAVNVPFASLRKYLPLLAGLLLQSDLDRRVASGGDLHDASSSSLPARPAADSKPWEDASSLTALRALAEGSMIHIIQPGQSNEAALSAQLPRFCAALDGLSGGSLGADWSFFMSLSQALLRYKRNLSHGVRDLVMSSWIGWIRGNKQNSSNMCLPVHECFVKLLNEWTHFGNVVLPRDTMLSLAEDAIKAAEESSGRKSSFAEAWKFGGDQFAPVKAEYEKMLAIVPEPHLSQWKEKFGIDDASLAKLLEPSKKKVDLSEEENHAKETKVGEKPEGDNAKDSKVPEPTDVDK